MSFCLFHSGVETGCLCGMSRQKGLRFYRALMDYEFGTHLEFSICSVVGIARVDEVSGNGPTFTQPLWPRECLQAAREQ